MLFSTVQQAPRNNGKDRNKGKHELLGNGLENILNKISY